MLYLYDGANKQLPASLALPHVLLSSQQQRFSWTDETKTASRRKYHPLRNMPEFQPNVLMAVFVFVLARQAVSLAIIQSNPQPSASPTCCSQNQPRCTVPRSPSHLSNSLDEQGHTTGFCTKPNMLLVQYEAHQRTRLQHPCSDTDERRLTAYAHFVLPQPRIYECLGNYIAEDKGLGYVNGAAGIRLEPQSHA